MRIQRNDPVAWAVLCATTTTLGLGVCLGVLSLPTWFNLTVGSLIVSIPVWLGLAIWLRGR